MGYARNGEAILINTPEGIKLNEKLIDQQELEELEQLHGDAFWERIDKFLDLPRLGYRQR